MQYYKLLDFFQDPFSNSPDPELLYLSAQHLECLQQIEIAVRLQRGLNIVSGRVGTGKTTLCREFLRRLDAEDELESYLILDPGYTSPLSFLMALWEQFQGSTGQQIPMPDNEQEAKNWIQNWLLTRNTEDNKTIVLLIDEGQKLEDDCLEVLRELLNFETNASKLLQIIIFAQTELQRRLEAKPNLWDRINLHYHLHALSFRDTRKLILFRIENSTLEDKPGINFSYLAFWAVYRITGGYPRKIVRLCHQIVLSLIGRGAKRVSYFTVRHCQAQMGLTREKSTKKSLLFSTGILCFAGLVLVFLLLNNGNLSELLSFNRVEDSETVHTAKLANKTSGPDLRQVSLPVNSSLQNKTLVSSEQENNNHLGSAVNSNSTKQIVRDKNTENASRALTGNDPALPGYLGFVRIAKGENLWNMMSRVYNTSDAKLLNRIVAPSLRKENSQIRNFDDISVQTAIRFPVIEQIIGPAPEGYWLSLYNSTDMAASYDFYRRLIFNDKFKEQELAFVGTWNADTGIRFYVLDAMLFSSIQKAQQAKKDLPAALRSRASLVNWKEKNKPIYILSQLKVRTDNN